MATEEESVDMDVGEEVEGLMGVDEGELSAFVELVPCATDLDESDSEEVEMLLGDVAAVVVADELEPELVDVVVEETAVELSFTKELVRVSVAEVVPDVALSTDDADVCVSFDKVLLEEVFEEVLLEEVADECKDA